ncbi:MAG: transcription antitermination protein NusB [Alphaproteobacteria bacterium]|nr:transcription antitermination protein NusB [Alphaproteobacteria bacterium]
MTQIQDQSAGPSSKIKALSARLSAVQALYQISQSGQSVRSAVNEFLEHRMEMEIDGEKLARPDGALLKDIVYGVEDRRVEIEAVIAANLKKDAAGRKIEPLLHAILTCGAYELLVHQQIDAPIIMNDYLNVAHAFYEKGEVALVNGILDTLATLFRA